MADSRCVVHYSFTSMRVEPIVQDTDEEDLPTPIVKITEEDDDTPPVPPTPSTKPKSMSNDLIVDGADLAMVEKSELGSTISRQLKTAFEPMEIWYLRSSIEKVSPA